MPQPEAIYRPLRRIISKRLSLIQYREEGAQQTLRELRLLRESMRGMSIVEQERVMSRLKNPGAFRKYVFDRRGPRALRKGRAIAGWPCPVPNSVSNVHFAFLVCHHFCFPQFHRWQRGH